MEGFTASDVMAIGTARELPEREAAYREGVFKEKLLQAQLRLCRKEGDIGGALEKEEEIAQFALLLDKLALNYNFAANCARYVKEDLKREPWEPPPFRKEES